MADHGGAHAQTLDRHTGDGSDRRTGRIHAGLLLPTAPEPHRRPPSGGRWRRRHAAALRGRPCGFRPRTGFGHHRHPRGPGGRPHVLARERTPVRRRPENIALFHTPDGWTSDRPPQGDQRLKATHSYSAGFVVLSDGGGVDYQGVVHFTAADLARLEPGQVWAGGRTMTVEEFEKHTGQECDDGWF